METILRHIEASLLHTVELSYKELGYNKDFQKFRFLYTVELA